MVFPRLLCPKVRDRNTLSPVNKSYRDAQVVASKTVNSYLTSWPWGRHLLFSSATSMNGSSLSVQNAGLIIRNRQRSVKMLVRYFDIASCSISTESKWKERSLRCTTNCCLQILVVVVFATCWLPISVYHLRRDFESSNGSTSHSIFLFLLLHWTAMSSTVIDLWTNLSLFIAYLS